jgi:hypothetical protein
LKLNRHPIAATARSLSSTKRRREGNRPQLIDRLESRLFLSSTPATARGYTPPPKLVTTKIVVTPSSLALADGTSYQYKATAYDQNGKVMAVAPAFTWTLVTGGVGGEVSSTGLYTAPASGTGVSTLQISAGTVKTTVVTSVTAAGAFTSDSDVGSPALMGHYSFNGTIYTVSGSGTDIWNASDQFNFASTPINGDSILEARITAIGNTDPWAKAGVMFRATSAAGSQDVYMIETPAGVVQLLNRTATNIAATTVGQGNVTAGAPTWVKLVREGNSFAGLWSSDGTNWTQLGTAGVTMNATVSGGLVASSHTTTTISTSTFDNVQVMTQPTSGIYRLAARIQPTLSLDIIGFGNANETGVQLWTANYTSNQQWLIQAQGDGTFKIYAYSGENSLQMLDLTNGSTADGNLVNTYTDNGNSAQRWIFVPVAGGYYRIVPKNGENTLQTLDIQNGANAALSSRTDIYTYGGGTNQQFSLLSPGTLQVLPSPKKGLAGTLGESANIHNSWGYDWGSGGAGSVPSGVEYDPMAWGYYGNSGNGFYNFINGLATGGAKDILGFNEPDSTGQANLSVASALQGWGIMQSASNGVPLISPACVDDTDSWMQSFMAGAAADGYRVDAVAIHWYGGDDPTGFINYVNEVHNLYNKPIWITEFCPADWSGNGGVSVAEATSFMETVVPQLNAMSFVQRYSWFSASPGDADLGQGALFNSDGTLTPLGSIYSRL